MKKSITRVLIIGSGGREHALGWKLAAADRTLYFAPGNGGTRALGTNIDLHVENIAGLKKFAHKEKIDITIVGPEVPLALGIVDTFVKAGLPIFGPSKKAARLESDKGWAADFMGRHMIPHPFSKTFTSITSARAYVKEKGFKKIVIKASGLAQGKGVVLPQSEKEALATLEGMMQTGVFGQAGKRVVIQEKLVGPEISVLAFCDGKTVVPLLPAQDHKRIFAGDLGPNTGGMGAYAPVPFVTSAMINTIGKIILQPTVDGMKKEGYPYTGILYAGLMLTTDGPKVLEYNARFGDPETQPLVMLLKSDLLSIFISCIQKKLTKHLVRFHKGYAATVTLAAAGYPGSYKKGYPIFGLNKNHPGVIAFQAGTEALEDSILTHGGRVLAVTATALRLADALKKIYRSIGKQGIYFEGMQYRKDIGKAASVYKK